MGYCEERLYCNPNKDSEFSLKSKLFNLTVPMLFNRSKAVPIPINLCKAGIGAVQVAINEKKIKTWAEIEVVIATRLFLIKRELWTLLIRERFNHLLILRMRCKKHLRD
jgi:hypothetical protein